MKKIAIYNLQAPTSDGIHKLTRDSVDIGSKASLTLGCHFEAFLNF